MIFEPKPRTLAPAHPNQNTHFLSPLFSHTSARSRPQPFSFDILPQNTRGRVYTCNEGSSKSKLASSSTLPKLPTSYFRLQTRLTPLPSLPYLELRTYNYKLAAHPAPCVPLRYAPGHSPSIHEHITDTIHP